MIEQFRFYLRHSINDLRVNGQRTIFALLCIAAGVAAIVSLQTLGVMISNTLTGGLQESNRGDIRLATTSTFGDEEGNLDRGKEEGVIASGGAFTSDYITLAGIEQIRDWLDGRFPGQTEITYRETITSTTTGLSVSIPSKETEKSFVTPYMVDVKVYPFYGSITTQNGRSLSEAIQAPTDVVLSDNLADELDAEIGDTVRISGATEDFTLRGIVETSEEGGMENILGALFGYYFIDRSALDLFPELDPGADIVYIRLDDPSRTTEVADALGRRFPYLNSTTTVDLEELNSQISNLLNDLVTGMGLVSLLIGGIGIVNTMLVIVRRRTTEVAVLKTVGLEGEQITMLFLVEAILMGILGSLAGILLGWFMAFLIKGVAETFLAQSLTFTITLAPPLTGLIVGIVVTAIFGLLPTLAAGQVRPNLVLRPSDSVVPKSGRARTFVAVLVVMLALSLVTQGLVHDLLDIGSTVGESWDTAVERMDEPPTTELPDSIRDVRIFNLGTGVLGAFLFEVMALTMLSGGILSGWARRHLLLRILRWLMFPVLFPILGFLFGYLVPGLLLMFLTFVLVGILYVLLWIIIWLVGRFFPTWRFIDLKLALRSMLASKGRAASTLLALVVGVFTLSLITMLADTLSNFFNQVLEQEVGGNVVVFAATGSAVNQIDDRLSNLEGVHSYTVASTYETEFVSMEDVSENRTLTMALLRDRVAREAGSEEAGWLDYSLGSIDGRGVHSNLPDVTFAQGRQLTPEDAGQPVLVLSGTADVLAAGIDVGDKLTFAIGSEANPQQVTFEVIGIIDRSGGEVSVGFGAQNYAPSDAFPATVQPDGVSAIVDVDEAQIGALRRSLSEVPGVFVLETKLLNDLINRLLDQFTSFPILVAALGLFTGGVVIANSVALTTLERRREIGIMKAVGLQRERVLGMLLLEYGLMGLIGGLIGVGIGGVSLLYLLVKSFGGQLGEVIPYLTAFELMGLCVLIALVAAIVTAWGASGEKPLNVLRYE